MITGVPAHVDGRMLDIAADSGVRLVNRDRMWHYTEGIEALRNSECIDKLVECSAVQ
jgi:predicted oxidoreductase